jgi:hypothetical protein
LSHLRIQPLHAGAVVVTEHNLELRVVVIAPATEEQARESAEGMGQTLDVVPGERFYEVEVTIIPIGSLN